MTETWLLGDVPWACVLVVVLFIISWARQQGEAAVDWVTTVMLLCSCKDGVSDILMLAQIYLGLVLWDLLVF